MPGQGHGWGGQNPSHRCSPPPLPATCPTSEPGCTPWARCGYNMGTPPPHQCDKGCISLCPWSCMPFARGWGAPGPCAPTQGCHELSRYAEVSPESLPRGAAIHPPAPALCDFHTGCFPGRTNGPGTCPALQLVLWLLPGHVHLQQRHRGLSGQGADSHPCQPA